MVIQQKCLLWQAGLTRRHTGHAAMLWDRQTTWDQPKQPQLNKASACIHQWVTCIPPQTSSKQLAQERLHDSANLRWQDSNNASWSVRSLPRSREVGQSYLTSVWSTFWASWAAVGLVWEEAPGLVCVKNQSLMQPHVNALSICRSDST